MRALRGLLLIDFGYEDFLATKISWLRRFLGYEDFLATRISWKDPCFGIRGSVLSPGLLLQALLEELASHPAARGCSGNRGRVLDGRLRRACHKLCADNS